MSSNSAGPLVLLKFPVYQYLRTSVNAYSPHTPSHPRHVGQYRPDLLCILLACGTGSESSCADRLVRLKRHDTWVFRGEYERQVYDRILESQESA